MQQYFNRMSMFVNDQALPQRIRFMIQDVIDLRRHRWVPRKAIVGDGPLPIHEVRIVLYRLDLKNWKIEQLYHFLLVNPNILR